MSKMSKEDNMSKSTIYNKASAIISAREFEQHHFIRCLKAGICPSCGEPLRTTGLTSEDHVLCICKKGCPLISPDNMDYSLLTRDIWKKCVDNTIRRSAVTAREIKKMTYVNKVYQEAVDIMTKREIDLKEFMGCLEAGICPSCGKPLQITTHSLESLRVECKKRCVLISPEGVDYQFITLDIWRKCINNNIRKAAIEG